MVKKTKQKSKPTNKKPPHTQPLDYSQEPLEEFTFAKL